MVHTIPTVCVILRMSENPSVTIHNNYLGLKLSSSITAVVMTTRQTI